MGYFELATKGRSDNKRFSYFELAGGGVKRGRKIDDRPPEVRALDSARRPFVENNLPVPEPEQKRSWLGTIFDYLRKPEGAVVGFSQNVSDAITGRQDFHPVQAAVEGWKDPDKYPYEKFVRQNRQDIAGKIPLLGSFFQKQEVPFKDRWKYGELGWALRQLDKLGNKLEPQHPVIGGAAKSIGNVSPASLNFLAGEMAGDPLTWVPPGAVGKVLKPVGKVAGAGAKAALQGTRAAEVLGKAAEAGKASYNKLGGLLSFTFKPMGVPKTWDEFINSALRRGDTIAATGAEQKNIIKALREIGGAKADRVATSHLIEGPLKQRIALEQAERGLYGGKLLGEVSKTRQTAEMKSLHRFGFDHDQLKGLAKDAFGVESLNDLTTGQARQLRKVLKSNSSDAAWLNETKKEMERRVRGAAREMYQAHKEAGPGFYTQEVRKLGGINPEIGGIAEEVRRNVPRHLIRKQGLGIDKAAQSLGLESADDLFRALEKERTGKKRLRDFLPEAERQVSRTDPVWPELQQEAQTLTEKVNKQRLSLKELLAKPELPPELRNLPQPTNEHQAKLLEYSKGRFDDWRRVEQEKGVLQSALDDYVTHIYRNPREEISEKLTNYWAKKNAGQLSPHHSFTERMLNITLEEAKAIGLDPVEDIGEILLIRHKAHVRAVANREFFDEIKQIPDLILPAKEAPETWRSTGLPEMKGFLVHPEVASKLHELNLVMERPESVRTVMHHAGKVISLWKGYALASPRTAIRNGIGITWNNYLAGLRDVGLYKQADDVLRSAEGALKTQGDTIPYVVLKREAEKRGIGAGGLYGTNAGDIVKTSLDVTPAERVATAFNPLSTNNLLISKSRDFSGFFEDRGRLALFMDYLSKHKVAFDGGDMTREAAKVFDEASRFVKKYHGDYINQTPAEKFIKYFIPFWTWKKFNTLLQFESLVQNPRAFRFAGRAKEGIENLDPEGTAEESPFLPQYLLDQAAVRLPFKSGDKSLYLNTALPIQDLNPPDFWGAVGPWMKYPIERATNRNLFYGEPIEKYPGQMVKAPPLVKALPKSFKEFLGAVEVKKKDGSRELQIPAKTRHLLDQSPGILGDLLHVGPGMTDSDRSRVWGAVTGVRVMPFDPAAAKRNAMYDYAEQLRKRTDLERLLGNIPSQ